jgi:uncharacterized BrkB/YihY/UPF0761 family membrane protein
VLSWRHLRSNSIWRCFRSMPPSFSAVSRAWLALLLIFFYYVAMIVFLGAEVNAFFVARVQPMPNDLVSFVTTLAGTLNQDIPVKEAQTHVDTQPTEQATKEHAIDVVTKPEAAHGETVQ